MSKIRTVLGSISPQDLGVTLMHEHIVARFNEKLEDRELDYAVKELKKVKMMGCQTIVEVSPPKMFLEGKGGRNIQFLQRVAKESGLNIICCTGYYQIPPEIKEMTVEDVADKMVKEISEGIEGTNVQAGVIKVAANSIPLNPLEEKIFLAAGIAQSQTGVPICCHSIFGPREQLETLIKGGADPEHCYFSHVEAEFGWEGRTLEDEAKYLLEIARRGGALLFNNFGFEHDTPWNDLVFLIRYLVEKGFDNRVLISMDVNWIMHNNGLVELEAEDANPECRKRNYAYLFTHAIPALEKAGIAKEAIKKFLIDNPKNILTPFKP
jgi:phosphotriesterase-related protein